MNIKYLIIIICTILSVVLWAGCSSKSDISSDARIIGLRDELELNKNERYEIVIYDYLPKHDQIGIIIYYDDINFNQKKINDLMDIKKSIERYMIENKELYSKCICNLTCYSLDKKNFNIPINYINFYNSTYISENWCIDCMEINENCEYESYSNQSLDIKTLSINFEYTKVFDINILTHFPNLTCLNIPSVLIQESEDIKTKLPENCTINYKTAV